MSLPINDEIIDLFFDIDACGTFKILRAENTETIVCFRNLEKATKDALALFGNKDAGGIIILRPYEDYLHGYDDEGRHFDGYEEVINRLQTEYPLNNPEAFLGEEKEKDFIRQVGLLLKLRNILTSFDEFNDPLCERTLQDYISVYTDLYDKYRKKNDAEKEDINDDLVFEIELVKQIEVNIDYILKLIIEYNKGGKEDKELVASINSAMNSSFGLRSKVQLINDFIESMSGSDVENDWNNYIEKRIVDDLEEIISDERLNQKEAYDFIHDAIDNGRFDTSGTNIDSLLPPMSRFGGSNREETKKKIVEKLKDFFNRYWDLGINVEK